MEMFMTRRMIAGLAVVALGLAAAACGDDARVPVAPHTESAALRPAAALTASRAMKPVGKVRVDAMRWRTPLDSDLTASAVIGPMGGVLVLPATGLRLVVPAGAVSQPTRFGVTALAGKLAAYDFEPAGSVFPVALRIEQDPSFVDTRHGDVTRARAGYFPNRTDLDQVSATGDVAEVIPVTWSPAAIAFPVGHFSGYIMTWGLR
jgi:hypothetical protein